MMTFRDVRTSAMSRRIAIPAILLAAVFGLAGCSAGVNGAAGGALSGAPMPGTMQDMAAQEFAVDANGAKAAVDRSIIVTGWATILADDPQAAADAASTIVEQAGGRIDARNVQAPTDYSGGSASLTLRIPAESLDAVLADLGELGRIQSVSTNASDVTVEVQDLDARIGALRTSIERLEALQEDATSVDALIQLETAISDRQAQLESLEAQQRYLDDQVSMSTLTVDFVSQPVLAEPEPGSFWDGIQAGWLALGAFFSGLIVAFGVLVPWLIPLAIIGAIIWISIAASRSKRAKRQQTGPGATQPPEGPPISG